MPYFSLTLLCILIWNSFYFFFFPILMYISKLHSSQWLLLCKRKRIQDEQMSLADKLQLCVRQLGTWCVMNFGISKLREMLWKPFFMAFVVFMFGFAKFFNFIFRISCKSYHGKLVSNRNFSHSSTTFIVPMYALYTVKLYYYWTGAD